MSRKDEFNQVENPTSIYAEWSTPNKSLVYYDKEKKENKAIKNGTRFLVLKETVCIKGWDNNSESSIWSNEVLSTVDTPLVVKSHKGGELARGLYADIRESIVNKGAKYTKNVYCMTEKGSIVCLQMYGAAIGAWMEFTQKTRKRLADEWFVIGSTEDRKQGSVNYVVPVFEFQSSLSDEQDTKSEEQYEILKTFLEAKLKRPLKEDTPAGEQEMPKSEEAAAVEMIASIVEDGDDDLPF